MTLHSDSSSEPEFRSEWKDRHDWNDELIARLIVDIEQYGLRSEDTCLGLAKELVKYARKIGDTTAIIAGYCLHERFSVNIHSVSTLIDSTTQIDALIPGMKNKELEAKLYRILSLAYFKQVDLERAEYYTQRALDICQEQGLIGCQALSHNTLGRIDARDNQVYQAFEHFRIAAKFAVESANPGTVSSVENEYIRLLLRENRHEDALKRAKELQELLIPIRESHPRAYCRILLRLASIYRFQGNFGKALECHLKAIEFGDKHRQPQMVIHHKGELSILYMEVNDLEKAIQYKREALEYFKAAGDQYNTMINTINLGLIKHSLDKQDTSLISDMKLGIKISEELEHEDMLAYNRYVLAMVYSERGRLDEAEALLDLARPVILSSETAGVRRDLLYIDAGVKKQRGLFQQAITLAKEALSNTPAVTEERSEVLWMLYELEREHGDRLIALSYLEEYKMVADSVALVEQRSEFTRLNMEHLYAQEQLADSLQFEAKKAVLAQELSQSEFRSKALGLGGALFLLLFLLILYQYSRVRAARKKTEELLDREKRYSEALYREQAKVKLKSLTKQMDPHFMFNSLQSISDYVAHNDGEAANRYLARFAQLIRQSLNYSQVDKISLEDEVELLETYLELEVLRFGHKFSYLLQLDESLDIFEITIPPMFVQPHVENAIWHGLRHRISEKGASLRLDFKKQGQYLVCTVTDNGVGRDASAKINDLSQKKHESVGTANIQKRLEIINRLQDRPIHFEVQDGPFGEEPFPGTRVVISFPV